MSSAGSEAERRTGSDPVRRWRGMGVAVFVIALVGGLVLRVYAPSPLWLDEALSVNLASLPPGDLVEALRHDGHPALYYLLLGWWMDVFGDGDAAVRALSGILSLAVVPVVWLVARRYEPPTAAAAATLALASPYLLRYGTEARMYALVVLLVALGWWAVETSLDRPSAPRLVGVAAVAAALVHTHYWTFWLVATGVVLLAWIAWRGGGERRRGASLTAGAALAGAATIVVWLGVLLDQSADTGTPWASRARPAEVLIETLQAVGGSVRFEGTLLGALLLLLVAIGGTALARATTELRLAARPARPAVPLVMIGGTLGIGAAAAAITGSAFEPRYAAVVVPFVLVAAARGLAMLPPAMGAFALLGVVLLGLATGFDEARRDRTQGAEVAAAIDAAAGPDDVVVVCPDQLGPAATRSLDHTGPRLAYPDGDGAIVDWSGYLDRVAATDPVAFAQAADAMAGDADVWVVAAFTYRGFEGRCEALIDTLGSVRSGGQVVAARTVFEPMALLRFTPEP